MTARPNACRGARGRPRRRRPCCWGLAGASRNDRVGHLRGQTVEFLSQELHTAAGQRTGKDAPGVAPVITIHAADRPSAQGRRRRGPPSPHRAARPGPRASAAGDRRARTRPAHGRPARRSCTRRWWRGLHHALARRPHAAAEPLLSLQCGAAHQHVRDAQTIPCHPERAVRPDGRAPATDRSGPTIRSGAPMSSRPAVRRDPARSTDHRRRDAPGPRHAGRGRAGRPPRAAPGARRRARWVQLELPLDLLDDPVALEVWRAL